MISWDSTLKATGSCKPTTNMYAFCAYTRPRYSEWKRVYLYTREWNWNFPSKTGRLHCVSLKLRSLKFTGCYLVKSEKRRFVQTVQLVIKLMTASYMGDRLLALCMRPSDPINLYTELYRCAFWPFQRRKRGIVRILSRSENDWKDLAE